MEECFRQVPGVTATTVGYSGGNTESPTYGDVCSGLTGHAEVIQVEFDPEKVNFGQLLNLFWRLHNPTSPLQDYRGGQYRSAVFFHSPEQEQIARAAKERLDKSGRFKSPVVTEISPAQKFHPAEEYHQQYYSKKFACKAF